MRSRGRTTEVSGVFVFTNAAKIGACPSHGGRPRLRNGIAGGPLRNLAKRRAGREPMPPQTGRQRSNLFQGQAGQIIRIERPMLWTHTRHRGLRILNRWLSSLWIPAQRPGRQRGGKWKSMRLLERTAIPVCRFRSAGLPSRALNRDHLQSIVSAGFHSAALQGVTKCEIRKFLSDKRPHG